jgi:hypothetical protein
VTVKSTRDPFSLHFALSRMQFLSSTAFWQNLLLVLASVAGQELFGQTPRAANLQVGHDLWTFKEGAPENVNALAQTVDGFLWLGTTTGLFRFDGIRFEAFHSPFGDKFLSTNIFSLFAPPSARYQPESA